MSDPRIAELLQLLGQARTLLVELDVTITRQDVASPAGGGIGGTPWPFDLAASESRTELVDAVAAFHDRGLRIRPATRQQRAEDLVEHAARAAYRQPAHELHDRVLRLRKAVLKGWQAIDRRPDRRRIGRCSCGTDVLARDEQQLVVCRYCGIEHDAEEQRARLLASARGIEVTIGGAVDAFKALGVKVTRGQVEGWVRRGLVTPTAIAGYPGAVPSRYSMGDLMAAWEQVHKRRLPGTPVSRAT